MNFKFNLKKFRQQQGLTQKELANLLNVKQPVVSDYERNILIPNLERLIQIAIILDVSLDDLITYNKAHKQYTDKLHLMKKRED